MSTDRMDMKVAPVTKIIDHSVVDGPGNRAAIFLQGCNFNCAYCHNPETIDPGEEPPTLQYLTPEQVVDRIAASVPFIRGITISGGECMLHEQFVYDVCRLAKRRFGQQFSCLLDSNGSVPYDKILSVVDGVMLDVKASNERAHRELTGASLAPVLEQVAALAKEGKLAEVRTVVMGDASDAFRIVQNVSAVIEAASEGKRIAKIPYKLIRYRPKGVRKQYLKDIKVPKAESLAQLKEHAEQLGFSPVTVI